VFSFIETKLFTRLVQEYLSDDEYRALQLALMERPEAGSVIRGSGGIRKLRHTQTALASAGPRQTRRLSHHLFADCGTHYLDVDDIPENVADDIPLHVLRQIRKEVEDG
jgi:hypothetical protein